MPAWRVYYDDGSTFDSGDGAPEDAPAFGVLCIVFPDEDCGRLVMHGWDWFYYHPVERNWWGADIHGLLDALLHNAPLRAVKQGRNTTRDNWRTILDRATNDPDFPPKSARSKQERPQPVS